MERKLACVAVLGALAGSLLTAPFAARSDCDFPAWQVELERSNEPDTALWPERAKLRVYTNGDIRLESQDLSTKVDVLEGGEP